MYIFEKLIILLCKFRNFFLRKLRKFFYKNIQGLSRGGVKVGPSHEVKT